MDCHCGTGRPYEDCCGPFLAGTGRPATAEALMRSRYAAYVTGNIDYLAATHDPTTASDFNRQAATNWSAEAAWKQLQVIATTDGGPDDDRGTVEFVAWFEMAGELQAHHERSAFRRVNGAWVFTGPAPGPRDGKHTRIGRNDPCPCASGQKYKKCHGR